jgi:hypothetical protein
MLATAGRGLVSCSALLDGGQRRKAMHRRILEVKMATWLGSVLAERTLHKGGRGAPGSGLLRLGRPKRVREDEYECRYEISGFGRVRRRKAYGVDELQAMSLALVALRAELKGLGGTATWLDQPAYLGLPVIVPAPFPEKFAKRLEGSIERAMERVATSFEGEMKQRYERKRRDESAAA